MLHTSRASFLSFRHVLRSAKTTIRLHNTEGNAQARRSIDKVPDLRTFMRENTPISDQLHTDAEVFVPPPYLTSHTPGDGRKVLVETYGCQMNHSDSEIINSILQSAGYQQTDNDTEADVILLNTCAIRENAESKIWQRLNELKAIQKRDRRDVTVGVLGCMAERLKTKLLETNNLCDVVVGPDAYRDLPNLLAQVEDGSKAINVLLSMEETYADIAPVRPSANRISAYVSIMRGCNNMCSYCIVPFTRGRERSRNLETILDEVKQLSEAGFKEIVLLGQNVNSYNDMSTPSEETAQLAKGFKSIVKVKDGGVRFAELLHHVSLIDPEMRIRFTSPHPKDFPDEVFKLIKERPNLCKSIHMPAQSGSSAVLDAMRRGHTREAYLELISRAREIIPNVSISSDFISGFCGETEEDHLQTISLLEEVKYDMCFMFAYSLREKTHAHRALNDDVPPEVKQRRLKEVIDLFYQTAIEKNKVELDKNHLVLIEKTSRKSDSHLVGRTDTNKKVIIPKTAIPNALRGSQSLVEPKPGDYVAVTITSTGLTLHGNPIAVSSIQEYDRVYSHA